MDPTRKSALRSQWPMVTMALVAITAAVWFAPSLRDWLIYNRDAILRGEIWRMFTGQFVHLSRSHFAYDVAATLIIGCVLEKESRSRYVMLCALAPICISGALIVVEPGMRFCGGLSGLATCFVVVLATQWLRVPGVCRAIGLIILAATAYKLTAELQTTDSMFVNLAGDAVRSRFAHIAGAVMGLVWSAALWLISRPSPLNVKSVHAVPG